LAAVTAGSVATGGCTATATGRCSTGSALPPRSALALSCRLPKYPLPSFGRSLPSTVTWKVTVPLAGTRATIGVTLPRRPDRLAVQVCVRPSTLRNVLVKVQLSSQLRFARLGRLSCDGSPPVAGLAA